MTDIVSKERRSYIMSKITSKNTSPELVVRKYLYHKGFRYRINVKTMPGSPDIVLFKYHVVIFINGCFWHKHSDPNCKIARIPKTRTDFWLSKLNKNVERDNVNCRLLKSKGWHVLTIWECQLKKKNLGRTLFSLDVAISRIILENYQK